MKLLMALCALALVCSAGATGASTPLAAPSGLHAFEKFANAPVKPDHTYTQMPAFAWSPVSGATEYELQLSTNRTFSDAAVFVDRKHLQAPVTSVDMQVPWMTGHPYAFWTRVRALSGARVSTWSTAFGFNTEWQQLPHPLKAPPGLIRWSPVDGATEYDVWFTNLGTHVLTLTNVADLRDYWPDGPAVAKWRVRAVRYVSPAELPNEIHAESHGPYTTNPASQASPLAFETANGAALTPGGIRGKTAIADRSSTPAKPAPTALMPGFAWDGTAAPGDGFRVYVYSDRQCVNVVTVGTAVTGPAWAPRAGGTAEVGNPGGGSMVDNSMLITSEDALGAAASTAATTTATAGPSPGTKPSVVEPDAGHITLPDNGWPAGRYWWTVVPVEAVAPTQADPLAQGPAVAAYHDLELPQDACASGRVWPFAMRSTPAVTSDSAPRVSGLNGDRVTSSADGRASFTELPVITWGPALGAQGYQIQLSRHLYPWVTVRSLESSVPSANLPLVKRDVGTWYYRVRGLNANLPGTSNKMTWSKTAEIRISGDRYVVVK